MAIGSRALEVAGRSRARPPGARPRVVGAGARLRLRPDRAGLRPARLPGRLSVRDGDLLQPLRLLGRLARRVRRARQLPRDPRQRGLPADRLELVRLHGHRAHAQGRAGRVAGDAARPQPPSASGCIRGAVLLPLVIPTALSTLGWWWMFDSLYSVVNWTGIRLRPDDGARAQLARACRPTPWPPSSPSTCGAGCPSSPSPCWPGWWRSPASSTRRPRWTAPARARASGT